MRKLLFTCLVSVCAFGTGYTQKCKVLVNALSLNYEGDCKGDKAEGHGKASGEDSYEGQFKAGYPDGMGKYTWKLGDWYEGNWRKGQREGEGSMHFKRDGKADSLLTGFWKRDIYQGRFEKPFKVISQSSKIGTVRVTKNAGYKEFDISITISSTSGGSITTSQKVTDKDAVPVNIPKMKLGDVDVVKGLFNSRLDVDNSANSTKTQLRTVEFPFRAIFRIGNETVEIEFLEEGNYSIDVNVLN